MAKDALCSLYTGSLTNTGSAGTAFDLKTKAPLEGLPVMIRLNGGRADTSTKTITLTISESADNFTTTANALFSKVFTISLTANASNYEEVITIVPQNRYIRVDAPTFSANNTGANATATAITVDIVTGRHNP